MGLLLPAFQSVRQQALRLRTRNQLKQITLAYHNLSDERVAIVCTGPPYFYSSDYSSVFSLLLTYIEVPKIKPGDPLNGPPGIGILSSQIVSKYISPAEPLFSTVQAPEPGIPGGDCSFTINFQTCFPEYSNQVFSNGNSQTMGDGSVRCLSGKIDPKTFWGMVTPARGEVLGDW